MKTKLEIKDIFGNVLFEHKQENNTLIDTVEEAVKRRVSLCEANLEDAMLYGANLENSNLERATLIGANLENSNLENSNLERASLNGANLYGANLERTKLIGANFKKANLEGSLLNGANLYGANLEDAHIPIYARWGFAFKNDKLKIGCKIKTIDDWKDWFENSTEEFITKRGTEDFKRLQAMYYAHEVYYNFLNKSNEKHNN